jgi:hypothetical protein
VENRSVFSFFSTRENDTAVLARHTGRFSVKPFVSTQYLLFEYVVFVFPSSAVHTLFKLVTLCGPLLWESKEHTTRQTLSLRSSGCRLLSTASERWIGGGQTKAKEKEKRISREAPLQNNNNNGNEMNKQAKTRDEWYKRRIK